jgi:glycosyltransferase involved in cell wall biosynthesis
LRQENPDILLIAYRGSTLSVGGLYSILHGKKFIFRAASTLDAELTLKKGRGLLDAGFLAWGFHLLFVRNANVIVTNAKCVADAFRRHLPRKTVLVIPNGLEIESPETMQASHVLWLGRMHRVKNPSMFVKLAKELPDIPFIMSGSGPLHQQIADEASKVPNLMLTGTVSGEQKRKLLGSAFALVNTSLAEGFPNTLIEAGINRVPYISFVDPDEVICGYELGYHVRSFQELTEKTALLVRDRALRAKIGSNIRRYVEKNHDIKKSVSEYENLVRSLFLTH